jgi:hypothetical protein
MIPIGGARTGDLILADCYTASPTHPSYQVIMTKGQQLLHQWQDLATILLDARGIFPSNLSWQRCNARSVTLADAISWRPECRFGRAQVCLVFH